MSITSAHNPPGRNLTVWPHPLAGEAGKCSLTVSPGGESGSVAMKEQRSTQPYHQIPSLPDHTHPCGLGYSAVPVHSGSKSLALTGAVGCTTTAMVGWRRKAAISGHKHTNTDLHGDWSPVVRLGLLVQDIEQTWVFAGSEFSRPSRSASLYLGGQSWGREGQDDYSCMRSLGRAGISQTEHSLGAKCMLPFSCSPKCLLEHV